MVADSCTYNLSGTLDGLAFLDKSVGTEKHDTDVAGFEVHAHALDTRGEPVVAVSGCSFCLLRTVGECGK